MQPQASLAGLCWPAAPATVGTSVANPASLMFPGQNPAMAMALAAMRGGAAPSGLYPTGLPATGYPPAAANPATTTDPNLASLVAGFYQMPTAVSSAAGVYNPVDVSLPIVSQLTARFLLDTST